MSIYQRFCAEIVDEKGRLESFKLNYADDFNFAYDVVDVIAAEEPDKVALIWCDVSGRERIFTFADMMRLSNRAANVFAAAGIGYGDKVMTVLKRHYEYWYVALALHKLGAVLIPVTHMLTADDLTYRMNTAGVKAVICTPDEDIISNVQNAVVESPSVKYLWSVQQKRSGFNDFNEDMAKASDEFLRQKTAVTDPMILYFTSGTTGYPKAVMHDHVYPLAHIITAKYWQQVVDGGLHFTVAETGWGKNSWGKLYGQWLCGSAVMVFDFDNFDPKQLINIINHYQVSTFCAPPTVYRYLVKKGLTDMPSLKHASTAGEALYPDVFKRFYDSTGLCLNEGYGQTESTLLLANFCGMEAKPGSMGLPSPLYHVELHDVDGNRTKCGEIGEIVVVPDEAKKPDGIFMGYYENAELYNYVWRDGVYHTGDTAWQDEDGYYWFYGRIDDVIKTGGFRVGPYEIEHILIEHPAVLECSVIGIPDDLRGQAIKAFIILDANYSPSNALQKEIKEFCNSRLAEYKWIRNIEFVAEMPKTISGKIRKTELRKRKADIDSNK